jgi:hypothetical protein
VTACAATSAKAASSPKRFGHSSTNYFAPISGRQTSNICG